MGLIEEVLKVMPHRRIDHEQITIGGVPLTEGSSNPNEKFDLGLFILNSSLDCQAKAP